MGIWDTIKSLFQIHNETMNVWTHLAGAIVFLLLLAHVAFNHAHPLAAWVGAPAPAAGRDHDTVLRLLDQPLMSGGRHTPRLALLAWTAEARRQELRAAHQQVAASRGLLQAIASSVPVLDSLAAALHAAPSPPAHPAGPSTAASAVAATADAVEAAASQLRAALSAYAAALSTGSGAALAAAQTRLRTAQAALTSLAAPPMPGASLGGAREAVRALAAEAGALAGRLEVASELGAAAVARVSALSRALFESEADLDADGALHATRPATDAHMPRWPLFVFIASAITCLLSSALFHLLYVIDAGAAAFWQRVDLAGIAFLIAGSTVPVCYYGLYCAGNLAWAHIAFTVAVNSLGLVLVLLPRFAGDQFAKFRVATFIAAGVSGVGSIAYIAATYGPGHPMLWTWLPYTVVQGVLYISGTFFYASKWPESRFPGKFDLFFSSHQIWHLFVLSAAVMHYVGMIELFLWRRHHMCSAEP